MSDPIRTKLSAARTRLILDKPFLGALVLRLPLVPAEARWCRTTATDARALYYNPRYIEALTPAQTQFVLAHEALHCALSHFARRQHRVKRRWDVACDLAINPLLAAEGLEPPPEALLLDEFAGMSAEEIYPHIDEQADQEPFDRHLYDEPPQSAPPTETDGAGARTAAPPSLSPDEREALARQWRQRLAGAAQQALQAGKLGGLLARALTRLLQPELPWRALLARFLFALARDDYSYARPSRREGPAILPGAKSGRIELIVVLDTSGSISQQDIDRFLSEVDALKGQVRARVTLHACDARLDEHGPWVFEPWEPIRWPERLRGGGGTRFVPAIEWAEARDIPPDALLYFTDARGEFPSRPPAFPVLWLVKGKAPVPWGERVQLN